MSEYIVEVSPHIRSKYTVWGIMLDVIIALMPVLFASTLIFGPNVIFNVIISILVCVLTEHLFCLIIQKPTSIKNLSAVITGILYVFVLPPGIPIYILIIGAVISILIGKLIFGGLGHNPFNPALIGRAFLLASWPTILTTWHKPFYYKLNIDVLTTATPLALSKIKMTEQIPSYLDLFLGIKGGSIGEVSVLAIIIGAIYLLLRKVISWHIPVIYISTVFIMSLIFGENPLFQILSGGLFLGAFFMATDYSTSPFLGINKIIFGFGCGILTCLIRFWGGFPEGVCYSILIMNMITPLLNYYIRPKRYGIIKESA